MSYYGRVSYYTQMGCHTMLPHIYANTWWVFGHAWFKRLALPIASDIEVCLARERKRERKRERATHTERERERQTERQTETERGRQTEIGREGVRETERGRERERETERDREKEMGGGVPWGAILPALS